MTLSLERRLLQLAILLAACVPLAAGLGAVITGAPAGTASHDSHYRYLSGLLFGVGLLFWSAVPAVERRTGLFRALTFVVVVGGLARVYGLLVRGDPGEMRWALVMELAVTPMLCLWQGRLVRRFMAAASNPAPS